MKKSKRDSREIAVHILCEIDRRKEYDHVVLQEELLLYHDINSLDKAFITELVKGTVKNQIHIDHIINQYSKIKTKKMKPWILNILRIGVYQMKFLTKIPLSAACNESVKLAKKRGFNGLAGFVNGVLRTISRNIDRITYPDEKEEPIEYLSVFYSYPNWLIQYWLEKYPYDFVKKLCEKGNEAPTVTIRYNPLKIDRQSLQLALESEGVKVTEGHYLEDALQLTQTASIANLVSFQQGLFQVQDESSMLVGHILDPQPGEVIFDLCAAPGGKTTQAAERMNNQGQIIARDISNNKLDLIDISAKRLGISIINTQNQKADQKDIDSIQKADRVLIDAPCSGLGIIRKKPDIKFQKKREDIVQLAKLQRNILDASWDYVKPGGVLVYSTCTITAEENIDNILWFIENYPFVLEDISSFLPFHLQGVESSKGFIQLFPHLHQIDGFFIARLRRKD
ncbi:MAG: 16S rRNA (cytosine(967)-C(5))-methyltransferase RsmB [Epulopiscium sp.]|nr:16S rRNA (cytosine(967)-C(5))-methyltransferase RsmB [Candidatus Epulonipiscium sp.]